MLHDTTEQIYRYNTGSINMLKEIKHCLYVDLSGKNFFGNRRSKVYNVRQHKNSPEITSRARKNKSLSKFAMTALVVFFDICSSI